MLLPEGQTMFLELEKKAVLWLDHQVSAFELAKNLDDPLWKPCYWHLDRSYSFSTREGDNVQGHSLVRYILTNVASHPLWHCSMEEPRLARLACR